MPVSLSGIIHHSQYINYSPFTQPLGKSPPPSSSASASLMYVNALACAAPKSLDFEPSLCDHFGKKLKTICLLLRNSPGERVIF